MRDDRQDGPADQQTASALSRRQWLGRATALLAASGVAPARSADAAAAAATIAHDDDLEAMLHADCLPWLRERRVAVLSSDSDSDVHPPQPGFAKWTEPVHMVAIPYMGMALLDQTELDALAIACAEEKRWSFFVTAAPWRFKGATGAEVNPLALF